MRVLAVGGGLLKGKHTRAVKETVSGLELRGDVIEIPRIDVVDFGNFTSIDRVLIGRREGGGISRNFVVPYASGWLYSTFRQFKKMDERNELVMAPEGYRMEIDVSGAGKIELPGYRLGNGVLVLYVFPSYVFSLPGAITVSDSKAFAQVSLRAEGNCLKGDVEIQKENGQSSEVRVSISTDYMNELVFWGDKSGSFSYEFMGEPLLIVSHEKILSPHGLLKVMGAPDVLSGHGEFGLRVELVRGLGKMTKKETRFRVDVPVDEPQPVRLRTKKNEINEIEGNRR